MISYYPVVVTYAINHWFQANHYGGLRLKCDGLGN